MFFRVVALKDLLIPGGLHNNYLRVSKNAASNQTAGIKSREF